MSDEDPNSASPERVSRLLTDIKIKSKELREKGELVQKLTKHQIEAAHSRAALLTSVAPPPVQSESDYPMPSSTNSIVPSKNWIVGALRAAGPKAWIVLLVVGALFALGGGEGIAKLFSAYRRVDELEVQITDIKKELSGLKAADNKCLECCKQAKNAQTRAQIQHRQVWSKFGVEWPLPLNVPIATVAEATLEIEVPTSRTNRAKPIMVKTPMALPERTSESAEQ